MHVKLHQTREFLTAVKYSCLFSCVLYYVTIIHNTRNMIVSHCTLMTLIICSALITNKTRHQRRNRIMCMQKQKFTTCCQMITQINKQKQNSRTEQHNTKQLESAQRLHTSTKPEKKFPHSEDVTYLLTYISHHIFTSSGLNMG